MAHAAELPIPVVREATECAHCGQTLGTERVGDFCCRGCRTVHGLLESAGLSRYYDLRRGTGIPVVLADDAPHDRKWLEPMLARQEASTDGCRLSLDLQGIHCAACVWLVDELFTREGRGGSIEVNPALGRAELLVPRDYPLEKFVSAVESFGYRVGPVSEREAPRSDGLLLRAGICLALAGNAMMLSAAIHLGLREGIVYEWAETVTYGASLLAMAIGAPIFVRGAWVGLRQRVLHLDLPIAIGMGLAFVGSTWSFVTRTGANYVDTLTAFVALMLLGRWLQTRVLERNRRELLADGGADALLTRRVVEGRVDLVPCTRVVEGDLLLVTPGDLVPVSAVLVDEEATCSFDWIDGESTPRAIARDGVIPSGAFNAGRSAIRVRATEAFDASEVWSLLRGTASVESNERSIAGVPRNLGGIYVVFVLVAAALAFVVTWLRGAGLVSALETTTATLVVTCPCAFGIAVPLAYEVVQSRLRRLSIFVRRPSLFERALAIRTVVFDKTGTLTTGRLRLADDAPLRALAPEDARALYDLAARSSHPKARAVKEALEALSTQAIDETRDVVEHVGCGLELRDGSSVYRLGSAAFVGVGDDGVSEEGALVFARDGVVCARFALVEDLRPEAREEVARLARHGYDVYLLSGDDPARCDRMGSLLGLAGDRVLGGRSPDEKAEDVARLDARSTLMVGDGLNDARALASAGVAATPSIERPFTAARCDFYFVTPGLEPISRVLAASKLLARVVRHDLVIAVVYNLGAVALCLAGVMRPWLAAILMPASSLGTLAFTLVSLTRRDAWKS